MDTKKLFEIVDKHVDQEGLAKDLFAEYALGFLEQIKQKVLSHEIDLIKGTELDAEAVIKVIDGIIAHAKG